VKSEMSAEKNDEKDRKRGENKKGDAKG